MRTYLVIIVIAVIVLLLAGRWFVKAPPDVARRGLTRALLALGLGVAVFLAATGRLHWLFAAGGALLALLMAIWRRAAAPQGPGRAEPPPQPRATRMSRESAYEILGLKPGASREEIVEAHRRLMQKVHPDRGGSSHLATEVNEAKSVLLDEE